VEEHDGAAVVAPKLGDDEVLEEKRPRVFGVGVRRTLLVVAYLLLAWPLVLPDSATFPSDIPEGLALAALTLAVVAGISLGYRRWRWSRGDQLDYRPSYRVSLTSVPVVLVALVWPWVRPRTEWPKGSTSGMTWPPATQSRLIRSTEIVVPTPRG